MIPDTGLSVFYKKIPAWKKGGDRIGPFPGKRKQIPQKRTGNDFRFPFP